MQKIAMPMRGRAQNAYISNCWAHQPGNKRCKKAADLYDRRLNYILQSGSMPLWSGK